MDQPKISIVVCYRDRKEHLDIFVPHIKNVFKDVSHEIIVVEQNDTTKFKRGVLLNVGAKAAKGEYIALHDVDYLPESANDYFSESDVTQPVRRVNFVNNDLTPRDVNDIPPGYRHFSDKVDDNFYGAVTVFKRDAFFNINGFCCLYDGWGLEDADLRERINSNSLSVTRNNGTFKALSHTDSFPGINDVNFQRNTQIFNEWEKYTLLGVNTQYSSIDDTYKYPGVDLYLKACNFVVLSPDLTNFATVKNMREYYKDTPEIHTDIWKTFKELVNQTPHLKNHRDFVIHNNWGYGNRALHWMWNILVQDVPQNFKFLEIGVFKGQTISLISLLNKVNKKNGTVIGVSPLNSSGDKYATHPDIDYETAISTIYGQFELDASDLQLIEGYSNDSQIIQLSESIGPYDIILVDGCHDYDVVVSDLTNYANMIKVNGYLVIDDASCYQNIPDNLIRSNWKGLDDVSRAVRDVTEKDGRFKEVFVVGHNRIFQRVS